MSCFPRCPAAAAALLVLAGCDQPGTPRCPVKGLVTLGGRPLEGGSIVFLPAPGNGGSLSGAEIHDGHYSRARARGLSPGTYRVQISSLVSAPKYEAGPTGAPAAKEKVPARYNVQSDLTVEVDARSENKFDFALKE